MEKSDNTKKRIQVLFCATLVAGGIMIANRVMGDDGTEILENTGQIESENVPQQTRIMIYTYENEVYMAEGLLDILQDGRDEGETIMELQGSIEKIEDAELQEADIEMPASTPTVLTI